MRIASDAYSVMSSLMPLGKVAMGWGGGGGEGGGVCFFLGGGVGVVGGGVGWAARRRRSGGVRANTRRVVEQR